MLFRSPVSGVGLNSYAIGQVIWNSSDLDASNKTYAVKTIDLDNDGKRDELLIGVDKGIYAFYSNGTIA